MAEVSLVVPVYKVENYLDRCVKSLRKQDLQDIEIILVDDGSPDACGQMCDKYATEDCRIKVIHKTNGGLSSARNAGLMAASGKYVGFVDSDDTINPQMYSKMLKIIQEKNVDFVMADYQRILSDGTTYIKSLDIRGGYYNKDDIRAEIFPDLIMGADVNYGPLLSVCHCLYNVEFLKKNNIYFDEEVRWSEDNIFSSYVGYYANSFYYMKGEGLYNYFQNPGTITTTYRDGAWDVYKLMNLHLKEFFHDKLEYDFSNQLKLHLVYYACVCVGQALTLENGKGQKEIYTILHDKELKASFNNLEVKTDNLKLKIQLLLMKFRCCRLLESALRRKK